jgi:hypothetical protein
VEEPDSTLEYFAKNYFAKFAEEGAGVANQAGEVRAVAGARPGGGPPPPGQPARPGQPGRPGPPGGALGHPLRVALVELLARRGTLTSTEAARELGESSGACSFHLRQLERYGHIEEVPEAAGRSRPWRLAAPAGARAPGAPQPGQPGDEFGVLARELENEGYRRWLAGRDSAPREWRDEAFSAVLSLTPAELTEVAEAIRSVIAARAAAGGRPVSQLGPAGEPDMGSGSDPGPGSEPGPDSGPATGSGPGMPVAVVVRMFPLLPASADD